MQRAEKVVWSATPTPFRADGSLDAAALEKVVEQHMKLGVTGLFLAGTCGEGPYMTNEQRVELVLRMRRLARGRLHLAAQVSDTSAARVKDNMLRMADAGADSAVIAAPWIRNFCTKDFLRRYFFEPMETAPLPVGIYIIKQPADSALDMAMWLEIAAHPKVRFLKDSSASEEYLKALAALKARRPELMLETGYEFDAIGAAAAGYDGCLLGTGILIGGMIRRGLEALAGGDSAAADAWQKRSNEFLWDLFRKDIGIWLGGLKYALKHLGIFNDEFMHLSFPITAGDRKRIDGALEREREFI